MRNLKEFMKFLTEQEQVQNEVFSFDELKKYVGTLERINYLNQTLELIDTGSSRAVYSLSETTVIKAAMNEKGEVQNQTEYELFHSAEPHVKEVLAAIEEPHDPKFEWIVMEKVTSFKTQEEFEKTLGIPPEMAEELFSGFCFDVKSVEELKKNIQDRIDYISSLPHNQPSKYRKNPKEDFRVTRYKKMLGFTDDFAKLCLAVPHLESNGGDLGRLNQLGLTRDGRLVILDYGFGHTAHRMYNPSIYQQYDAQRRAELDYPDNWDDAVEYDKYGNKIIPPKPRMSTKPAARYPKPAIHDQDDYIPF